MRLLLIRHGESLGNRAWSEGRDTLRYVDPGLTDLGHTQAERLAAAFADGRLPRPDHLLTSLMRRAVETAAPVSAALDLPVVGLPEAHEIGGVYKGEYGTPGVVPRPGEGRSALERICPGISLPDSVTEDGWFFGDVEPRMASWPRAQRVAADLLARYGPDDAVVALVAHGFLMQLVTRAFLEWVPDLTTPSLAQWLHINNTGTFYLSIPGPYGSKVLLHWINRTDHLTPDQITE